MHNYLVITGGSRGIGEKTIYPFIEAGWQVINISRSPCQIPNVINFNIDLSQSQNIEKNSSQLKELLQESKICLVHNAGFQKKDSINSVCLSDLHTTLETNLISAVALNNILIPFMLPSSSIIYIGSTLAEKAVPGNASYIISKHAVIGLMRATCQDLATKQITTCCICPGLVDTPLLHHALDKKTISWFTENKVIGKRLIKPEEIANVIYFCATHPVINGEIIHTNLGHFAD